jgi:UDP-N-acetylmuramoylalanine--D-glutamate ligase
MDLQARRVLVVGLGRSGRAAAQLARARGARVVGVDLRTGLAPIDGVIVELGPHRRERFLEADLIVVSPGVPAAQADLVAAVAAGVEVVGELGFAASFLHLPTIGVTGTNGKSTVTWFVGQILRAAGYRPFVGGNLGNPLSNAALDPQDHDCLVVEVSSYQLELPGSFWPDIGVILNLTPDHLARHGDMDGYAAAKARLFERMGPRDLAILPVGDERLIAAAAGSEGTRAWLGAHPGVTRAGRAVHVALAGTEVHLSLDRFTVPGAHNLDNAATAALIAIAHGADPAAVQAALDDLEALPHRMEVVAERDGVLWINDSKATNVDAARVGHEGLDRPAVVLLGGQGKPASDGSLGFGALAAGLARHRGVVAFGASGPAIAQELRAAGLTVAEAGTLSEAVQVARQVAQPGDAVLLSPGCASFDEFDDFEHRGRVFRDLVGRPS